MTRLLVRALPDVAPWRPLAVTAVVTAAAVFAAQTPDAGASRLRVGGALVAASCAFVLDDEAAVTLAAVPTTLLRRRLPRLAAAVFALVVWWVIVASASDALTGSGRPARAVVVESAGLAVIGLGVAALVARRSADTAGGAAGAGVAVGLFAASFLPLPTWWPLATERRLGLCLVAAGAVFLVASADRARRRLLLFL